MPQHTPQGAQPLSTSPPWILHQPVELLQAILSYPELNLHDHISFRLTCRSAYNTIKKGIPWDPMEIVKKVREQAPRGTPRAAVEAEVKRAVVRDYVDASKWNYSAKKQCEDKHTCYWCDKQKKDSELVPYQQAAAASGIFRRALPMRRSCPQICMNESCLEQRVDRESCECNAEPGFRSNRNLTRGVPYSMQICYACMISREFPQPGHIGPRQHLYDGRRRVFPCSGCKRFCYSSREIGFLELPTKLQRRRLRKRYCASYVEKYDERRERRERHRRRRAG